MSDQTGDLIECGYASYALRLILDTRARKLCLSEVYGEAIPNHVGTPSIKTVFSNHYILTTETSGSSQHIGPLGTPALHRPTSNLGNISSIPSLPPNSGEKARSPKFPAIFQHRYYFTPPIPTLLFFSVDSLIALLSQHQCGIP